MRERAQPYDVTPPEQNKSPLCSSITQKPGLHPKPPTSLLYSRGKAVGERISMSETSVFLKEKSRSSRMSYCFCPDSEVFIRWTLFYPRRQREINKSSSNLMENSDEAVYKCEYYKSKTRLYVLKLLLLSYCRANCSIVYISIFMILL